MISDESCLNDNLLAPQPLKVIGDDQTIRPFDHGDDCCLFKKYPSYKPGDEIWLAECSDARSHNPHKEGKYSELTDNENTQIFEFVSHFGRLVILTHCINGFTARSPDKSPAKDQ